MENIEDMVGALEASEKGGGLEALRHEDVRIIIQEVSEEEEEWVSPDDEEIDSLIFCRVSEVKIRNLDNEEDYATLETEQC